MTPLAHIVGKRIGHLDLIERLGNGPNGPTWLAIDTRRDRMVTLKLLSSIDPIVLAGHGKHLSSAIEQLTAVKHRSVVMPTASSGTNQRPAWVLRDYISGLDLRTLCKHTGPLDANLVFGILAEVASVLAAYHECGLVHGNLKRQNLFFTKAGGLKVVDSAITQTLLTQFPNDDAPKPEQVSSQAFLAPEQRSGAPLTFASDIYQFGVLAYWLITQSYPFQNTDHIHESDTLVQLKEHLQGAPSAVQEFIYRSLALHPSERTTTITEAKETIESVLLDADLTPEQAIIEGLRPFQYAFLVGQSKGGNHAGKDTEDVGTLTQSQTVQSKEKSVLRHPKLAAAPPDTPTNASVVPTALQQNVPAGPSYEIETDDPVGQTKALGPKLAARPANIDGERAQIRPPSSTSDSSKKLVAAPPVLFSMTSEVVMEPPTLATARTSGHTLTISVRHLVAGCLVLAGAGLIWWYGIASAPSADAPENTASISGPAQLEPMELIAEAKALMETKPEAALSKLKTAATLRANDPDIHLMLARVLKRLGRTREAANAFARAVRLRPAEIVPQQELIGTLLASGRPQEALKAASVALKLHGTDSRLYVLRAKAELAGENYLAASASLANATRLAPENPEAWKLLGSVRSRQERWKSAKEAWQQAAGLSPADVEIYAGLAHAIRRGEIPDKQAIELILTQVNRLPANQQLALDLARILTRDRRLNDAQRILQPYTVKYSEDWRGYFQLGLARLLQGEPIAASSAFEKAMEIQPGEATGWYNLGLARSAGSQLEKALIAFERAIQEHPELSDAHCERARTLHALGRTDSARKAYMQAAKDERLSLAKLLASVPLSSTRAILLREMPCGATFIPLANSAD
jgi:serine/threonine protein kinase/Flp pilus assembly protein TadD